MLSNLPNTPPPSARAPAARQPSTAASPRRLDRQADRQTRAGQDQARHRAITQEAIREARRPPRRRPQPIEPAVPPQGFETEAEIAPGVPLEPPSRPELAASVAELLGELAQSGLATGGRLLKDALGRLPGVVENGRLGDLYTARHAELLRFRSRGTGDPMWAELSVHWGESVLSGP